jgi:hypothetical protein
VPTFLAEYAEELQRIGDPAFAQQNPHPVLIVTGVVGGLGEQTALNKTLVTAPSTMTVQTLMGLIGRVFPVAKGKYTTPGPVCIGRTPDNDITIAESSISARHCFLRVVAAEMTLTDAGSTNGTLINDVRVPPKTSKRVVEGDVLTLGRFTLAFHTPRGFIKHLKERKAG